MPALLTNVAVVAGVVATVWITQNPLALFALLMLKELPVVISRSNDDDDEEEGGQRIGFIN